MAQSKSFDKTVKKLCAKKITDADEPILDQCFTVEQAIAAAVIKRALGGAADAVKLVREILDSQTPQSGDFRVDIRVVE